MVGARRFELPTSCSRSRRATKLRYAPIHVYSGQSSTSGSPVKVGARGFEPPTPCTPCKCATRLRHAPIRCDGSFAITPSFHGCFSSVTQPLPAGPKAPACQRQARQNRPYLVDSTNHLRVHQECRQRSPPHRVERIDTDRPAIAWRRKSYSNPCKADSLFPSGLQCLPWHTVVARTGSFLASRREIPFPNIAARAALRQAILQLRQF